MLFQTCMTCRDILRNESQCVQYFFQTPFSFWNIIICFPQKKVCCSLEGHVGESIMTELEFLILMCNLSRTICATEMFHIMRRIKEMCGITVRERTWWFSPGIWWNRNKFPKFTLKEGTLWLGPVHIHLAITQNTWVLHCARTTSLAL